MISNFFCSVQQRFFSHKFLFLRLFTSSIEFFSHNNFPSLSLCLCLLITSPAIWSLSIARAEPGPSCYWLKRGRRGDITRKGRGHVGRCMCIVNLSSGEDRLWPEVTHNYKRSDTFQASFKEADQADRYQQPLVLPLEQPRF